MTRSHNFRQTTSYAYDLTNSLVRLSVCLSDSNPICIIRIGFSDLFKEYLGTKKGINNALPAQH